VDKFWMVYTPGGSAPKRQHDCFAAAHGEALRLAEQNIGKEFYVLEATHVAVATAITSFQRFEENTGLKFPQWKTIEVR